MTRQPTNSSLVTSAGYESATNTLELELTDGTLHRYRGVSASVYAELLAATSIGAYFNHAIRDTYPHEKLDKRSK